jgi:hypothetical protein
LTLRTIQRIEPCYLGEVGAGVDKNAGTGAFKNDRDIA